MKRIMMGLSLLTMVMAAHAQDKVKPAADSAKPSKVMAYEKVITKDAVTRQGMFTVHLVDNKYFFEIPDSLLKRDILVVSRFISTPEMSGVYGGEKASERTIYFERGQGNKLLMRVDIFSARVKDSTQAIAKAVQSSSVKPIAAAFDIKTYGPGGNMVIDVTDFFRKDNGALSLDSDVKSDLKLGSPADDRSFINSIKPYPINVEVRTTRTYSTTGVAIPAAALSGFITLEMNVSMVLLPKEPMRKRLFDERVGYMASKYFLFDEDAQASQEKYLIQRYRLEPKPEDMEKYKRGELVEPARQIVYYIDPATPKKWRPYLIAGVNDWQQAFEQAGFKNAITAKEWPEEDTTMSLEDARFSVIRYLASPIPNAYGPRISDPRSGEIIESHVGWYHNVMKLIHDWYMIQVGPNDPRARKMEFDDELMGDLIRFVSSHEVGHTIGLRHNMGASSQTPVEKLRDKTWVEANGHTVSIMDYARFNYVAQPEDKIGKAGLYPRIGAYDKWAVQWGYKLIFNTKDEFEDSKVLNKWIVDSLAANPRLWFGGEGKGEDPRSQSEDLSDNVMVANEYGIKNLKRVVPELIKWTAEDGDMDGNLDRMYKGVVKQYSRYLYHVMKYIGGQYITNKSADQPGNVVERIPKAKVKEALNFIGRNLMEPPLWLYNREIAARLKMNEMDEIATAQNNMLVTILNAGMMYNLIQKYSDGKEIYTVTEYLADVKKAIWKPLTGDALKDTYYRNLQRMYVEKLIIAVNTAKPKEGRMLNNVERSDAHLYARAHLQQLKNEMMISNVPGALNQTHKAMLMKTIDKALKGDDK
ncbi:zinc-dependent metalloprotease [Chitinophaga rhizophila]|uniref:Zinc-dependent metalloprotease n=1 Tax=Chitinophaga rhizophila TaxID=2866212 RepID=A0ABS7GDA9_9BACT|nr:zinc-dependent metalloprotease [Chitinophaga rhizophila]MBW8684794.1 zinc-dependent metalloprotease [Chitinophaga rhizophila]